MLPRLTNAVRPGLAHGLVCATRVKLLRHSRLFSQTTAAYSKRFSETHEWVKYDGASKTCIIGITTYAAAALGDIVYVELPEIGSTLETDDVMGVVESVKSASDIKMPVPGEILEINQVLEAEPALINQDPEVRGWIAKVKSVAAADIEKLMTEEEYKAMLK